MVKRAACLALLILAAGPATGANAGRLLPPLSDYVPTEELVGINEVCMRNYENLEGDVCVPVEDDTGMVQFALDQI